MEGWRAEPRKGLRPTRQALNPQPTTLNYFMSIRATVDRAMELRSEIATRQADLDKLVAALIAAGLKAGTAGRHDELVDAQRDGTRWLARGSGIAVPIIFTADKLIGSFQKDSPKHQTIRTSLGSQTAELTRFYKPVNAYESRFKDGKQFRAEADKVLAERAPAFITACIARDKDKIPLSDVKIDWDHAEPVAKQG